jgi:imidazole glycerol phosphate synthase subunit HisF
VDGVAIASLLHYGQITVGQLKKGLAAAGVAVRL